MSNKINEINREIIDIIKSGKLYKNSNMLFLLGDNSTGKSEIGEIIKNTTDILVLDNFSDSYDKIPKDKKTLIITHNWRLLVPYLKGYEPIIVTQYNDLYLVIDVEILQSADLECYNCGNNFSKFLNNAISNCWSKLNEQYFQEYVKSLGVLKKSDELMIREIEKWRDNYE